MTATTARRERVSCSRLLATHPDERSDVPTTTSALEQLARDGKLPNIRPWNGTWQVRVHPFPDTQCDSIEAAITLAAEYRELREQGIRHVLNESPDDLPLYEWTDAALAHKRTRGGKRGPLSERGDKFWRDSLRRWGGMLDDNGERVFESPRDKHGEHVLPTHQRWTAAKDARGQYLALRPLSSLALWEVEAAVDERVPVARSQAAYEVQGLKTALRLARKRGARFDDRLLELDSVLIPKSTRGFALTAEQLSYLVARAPAHSRRAVSLMGTAGPRLSELLDIGIELVDVAARELRVPHPKEGRPKTIPLMHAEAELVREQLHEYPGARLFARPGGTAWRREHFYADVLVPARERAQRDWRTSRKLPDDATTPFDRIDNHRLRHTAITLMARAGLKPELIAQRVGHNDGGALILKTYRHVFNDELRLALDELGESLLPKATA